MKVAILCIGTEITRGEICNTNDEWLSQRVTELGFEVTEICAVDDDRQRIVRVLRDLSKRHEGVICTGGLGPTSDDLTSECAALAAEVPLVRDERAAKGIEEWFSCSRRPMAAINMKQADFPSGAQVLDNEAGTAPGFRMHLNGAWMMFFPGVPTEMKAMWHRHAVPWLQRVYASRRVQDGVVQVRLATFGEGESRVAQMLGDIESKFDGVTVAYRAFMPDVEVKLSARQRVGFDAEGLVQTAEAEVRKRLGALVYGAGGKSLVEHTADAIRAKGQTLAVAESCTGGMLAQMLTALPASDYFLGGVVAYSSDVKVKLLGVSEQDLQQFGAVSEQVARAMAKGVRQRFGATLGVGITGIAGPTGGTDTKPVGLVYWAVSHRDLEKVAHRVIPGPTRAWIQRYAVHSALQQVRELLQEL